MNKLSTDAKKAIVQKVLEKDGRTMTEIAKAHNIGCSTLSKWVRRYRDGDIMFNKSATASTQALSASACFQHLLAVAALDEAGVGAYCREHGIYSFQLEELKKSFMSQPQNNIEKQRAKNAELETLRVENKKLKQEIRRKDSALAEATALLILKKKASLIWGEQEDD